MVGLKTPNSQGYYLNTVRSGSPTLIFLVSLSQTLSLSSTTRALLLLPLHFPISSCLSFLISSRPFLTPLHPLCNSSGPPNILCSSAEPRNSRCGCRGALQHPTSCESSAFQLELTRFRAPGRTSVVRFIPQYHPTIRPQPDSQIISSAPGDIYQIIFIKFLHRSHSNFSAAKPATSLIVRPSLYRPNVVCGDHQLLNTPPCASHGCSRCPPCSR